MVAMTRDKLKRPKRLANSSTGMPSPCDQVAQPDLSARREIEERPGLADAKIAALTRDLMENERRLTDFVELASDWLWETDAEYRFTYVSQNKAMNSVLRVGQQYGLTRRETAPLDVSQDAWRRHDETLARREPLVDFRFARIDSAGRKRFLSVGGLPIFDEGGRFKGYRGVGHDLTKQVEAEQAVGESERRFRDYTEASVHWYWELDAELRFTFVSKGIERFLGYPQAQYLGNWRGDVPGLAGLPPDMQALNQASEAEVKRLASERKPFFAVRLARQHPNGQPRFMDASGKPFFDPQGQFLGYRGTSVDVTERVQGEAALRQQNVQLHVLGESLKQAERRFRDFAEASSHYFWESDPEDRMTYVSEGAAPIRGCSELPKQSAGASRSWTRCVPMHIQAPGGDSCRSAADRILTTAADISAFAVPAAMSPTRCRPSAPWRSCGLPATWPTPPIAPSPSSWPT